VIAGSATALLSIRATQRTAKESFQQQHELVREARDQERRETAYIDLMAYLKRRSQAIHSFDFGEDRRRVDLVWGNTELDEQGAAVAARIELVASEEVAALNESVEDLIPEVMAMKTLTFVILEGASAEEQEAETAVRRHQYWETVGKFDVAVNDVKSQMRRELGSDRVPLETPSRPWHS
jgi:hypothetical protein